MIKTLNKLRTEGNFLNLIKSIYEKASANLTLNGEKQDAFSLRLGAKPKCPLLPLPFNIVLEVLVSGRNGNKRHLG